MNDVKPSDTKPDPPDIPALVRAARGQASNGEINWDETSVSASLSALGTLGRLVLDGTLVQGAEVVAIIAGILDRDKSVVAPENVRLAAVGFFEGVLKDREQRLLRGTPATAWDPVFAALVNAMDSDPCIHVKLAARAIHLKFAPSAIKKVQG